MAMFESGIDVLQKIIGGIGALLVVGALFNLFTGFYNEDSAKVKSGWIAIGVGIGVISLAAIIPMAKTAFM